MHLPMRTFGIVAFGVVFLDDVGGYVCGFLNIRFRLGFFRCLIFWMRDSVSSLLVVRVSRRSCFWFRNSDHSILVGCFFSSLLSSSSPCANSYVPSSTARSETSGVIFAVFVLLTGLNAILWHLMNHLRRGRTFTWVKRYPLRSNAPPRSHSVGHLHG